MNKNEYINALQAALSEYSEELQKEILSDFDEYYTEASNSGKTEEEIVNGFGRIEDIISNIDEVKKPKELVAETTTESNKLNITVEGELNVDLEFCPSDDGQLTYELYDKHKLYLNSSDIKLDIVDDGSEMNINVYSTDNSRNFFKANHITFFIPESIIAIKTMSSCADIDIYNLKLEELFIENVNGDCDISDCSINDFEIKLKAGDLDISKSAIQNCTLLNKAGDIDISDLVSEQLSITNSAGDTDISVLKAIGITISCSAGDIDCDEIQCHSCTIVNSAGDIEVNFLDCYNVSINNKMGDIELNFKDEVIKRNKEYFLIKNGQEVPMNIKTLLGDIEVN